MIKICISGLGKAGKEIASTFMEQEDIKLVSAVCSPYSPKLGKDLGDILGCKNTGVIVESSDNLKQVIFRTKPDVVVDFSSPSAALKNAIVLSELKVNILMGTTGFSEFSLKRLFVLTRKYHNGIVFAPNITLGVNVLMLLTNIASSILNNYDFQITEMHYKNKKDSPSGTALKIAAEIEKGMKAAGSSLPGLKVPINSVRAGGVIGRHDVMIVGEDDKIEISHESFSRKAFALGALKAVHFINGKSGYYEMSDVLNLKKVLVDYLEKENTKLDKRYLKYIKSNADLMTY